MLKSKNEISDFMTDIKSKMSTYRVQMIEGSLINQTLDDGTPFGSDYDGRLGPLTHWIRQKRELFQGKTILDCGSNAGHFPIEYIRLGAAHVTAVEGRPEFQIQWELIKDHLPGIDSNKITWECSDIRTFKTPAPYTVISCLGLIYHTELTALRNVIKPKVNLIILESEIFGQTRSLCEDTRDRTKAITSDKVDHFDMWEIDSAIAREFRGWQMERISRRFPGEVMLDRTSHTHKFEGQMRGLWILKR